MRAFLTRAVVVWSALLMAASVSAQTQGLERVGPTSTAHGFPTWYQDKTGIALEFCQPLNQGELDGGWCLLLPGDTTVPEQFPGAFADEHFFFAADANAVGGGINALLVIGLEAAFAVGPVVNGDQLVFARIRIRFDAPAAGTYTVYHPYGVDVLTATAANERIFFTEDIGITCQGNFDCALKGRIGPFLLPSDTPGGVELPAVTGPVAGKLYIADPARIGPVTGSPVNQNFFRIEGPGGIVAQTSDFALMGRLFQGTMAGRVTVDRASYSRAAAADLVGKTDVFATAFPTTPTRMPAAAPVPVVQPSLDFFASACVVNPNGTLGQPLVGDPLAMVAEGSRHYGTISGVAIPAAVCVRDQSARDINGQIVPVFREARVTDTVKITDASYNPQAGSLTVTAQSSDAAGPVLTAELIGDLVNGSKSGPVLAPPAKILVASAKGGRAEAEVTTGVGMPSVPDLPVANNDIAAVDEDSLNNLIDVLANDAVGADPVVNIVGQPRLGVASVDLATNQIVYTPNANAFGNDLITYTVTVGGATSNPAFVSIAIRNLNDAPVAADDAVDGAAGTAIAINLFANDTDADGAADLRTATVTQTSGDPGVIWSVAGGVLTLSGPAGVHTFSYTAADAAGAASNAATVTVTLTSTETLIIVRAEFIASKRRWRVEGTSSITTTHNVFISFADGLRADGTSAAGTLVGTAQSVGGLWALDLTLAGANDPRVPTSPVYVVRPTRVYASTPGGLSPAIAFQLR